MQRLVLLELDKYSLHVFFKKVFTCSSLRGTPNTSLQKGGGNQEVS